MNKTDKAILYLSKKKNRSELESVLKKKFNGADFRYLANGCIGERLYVGSEMKFVLKAEGQKRARELRTQIWSVIATALSLLIAIAAILVEVIF